MDTIITEDVAMSLEKNARLYTDIKRKYYNNPTFSIRGELYKKHTKWIHLIGVSKERFIFAFEWLVGFEYRRDCVVSISKNFGDKFTLFGDQFWEKYVTDSLSNARSWILY